MLLQPLDVDRALPRRTDEKDPLGGRIDRDEFANGEASW